VFQNGSMAVFPVRPWQALAIGLPLAIAGYAIQAVLLRRRAARRRTAEPPALQAQPAPPSGDGAPPVPAPDTATPALEGFKPSPTAPSATPLAAAGRGGQGTQPDRPTSPWLPGLLELESDLDEAIDRIAVFVGAPPRREAARSCAEALDGLVPQDRRGPAYAAFVSAISTDLPPSELHRRAEALGVDLTAQLLSVRRQINPGG
jgi:hypothetical protein